MKSPTSLEELIDALRCLPGVGPKSAQRMAYYLLQHNRKGASRLAQALSHVIEVIQRCEKCNSFCEDSLCGICASAQRNTSLLCVVESPADLLMMEHTHSFKGLYFVLMGRLSPLDGIGPKEIHLDRLIERATDGIVTEVILATNFTAEGEATAHYVAKLFQERGLKVTRIARGLPAGGELEHVDSNTLSQALIERREV